MSYTETIRQYAITSMRTAGYQYPKCTIIGCKNAKDEWVETEDVFTVFRMSAYQLPTDVVHGGTLVHDIKVPTRPKTSREFTESIADGIVKMLFVYDPCKTHTDN